MVRWPLWKHFSILTINPNFLRWKGFIIPISLRKYLQMFWIDARFARMYIWKMRHFPLIFVHCMSGFSHIVHLHQFLCALTHYSTAVSIFSLWCVLNDPLPKWQTFCGLPFSLSFFSALLSGSPKGGIKTQTSRLRRLDKLIPNLT